MHLECVLRHTYEIKDGSGRVSGTVVIGEAVMIHVADGVAGERGRRAVVCAGCCVLPGPQAPAWCTPPAPPCPGLPNQQPGNRPALVTPPPPSAGRSPSGKLVVAPGPLAPVSRLGGNTYGRSSGLYDLPRPDRDPKTQKELNYTSKAG